MANVPLHVKEVNWSRFTVGADSYTDGIDIRCSVCGQFKEFMVATLPELAHWAVAHKCPQLAVN